MNYELWTIGVNYPVIFMLQISFIFTILALQHVNSSQSPPIVWSDRHYLSKILSIEITKLLLSPAEVNKYKLYIIFIMKLCWQTKPKYFILSHESYDRYNIYLVRKMLNIIRVKMFAINYINAKYLYAR